MNSLANMFQQALPNMPRLNQRLQQPGFGQPPQFQGNPSPIQHGTFTGQPQSGAEAQQLGQQAQPYQGFRQPVQNHQYNPPAWGQAEQPQWGAFQPPRMGGGMRGGFFDGNMGQRDWWNRLGGNGG